LTREDTEEEDMDIYENEVNIYNPLFDPGASTGTDSLEKIQEKEKTKERRGD